MNMLPHSAPSLSNSPVSHTLCLTVAARRAAQRLHLAAKPLVDAAVRTYRQTGNQHDGTRALRTLADRLSHGRGGQRA